LGRGPRCGAVEHVRRKVPIGYNGAPQIPTPKVPLPVDRSPNPTACLIPGPVGPMVPNGCRMRSAVFPQCTGQTDAPTDRPTPIIIIYIIWRKSWASVCVRIVRLPMKRCGVLLLSMVSVCPLSRIFQKIRLADHLFGWCPDARNFAETTKFGRKYGWTPQIQL